MKQAEFFFSGSGGGGGSAAGVGVGVIGEFLPDTFSPGDRVVTLAGLNAEIVCMRKRTRDGERLYRLRFLDGDFPGCVGNGRWTRDQLQAAGVRLA